MNGTPQPFFRRLSHIIFAYLIYLINASLIGTVIFLLLAKRWMLAAAVFGVELIFASSRWLQRHGAQNRLGAMGLFRNISLTFDGWVFSILTIFLTVAALNSRAILLYLIFSLLYSTLIVSGILGKKTTSGLEVSRLLPDTVEAGREFIVRLAVKNRKRLIASYAINIDDCPYESPSRLPRTVSIPALGAQQETTLRYRAVIPQRGLAKFRHVRIRSVFPFGFFEQYYTQEIENETIVLPRMGKLLRPLNHFAPGIYEEYATAAARRGPEEEFKAIRDYRQGDNPRHIHWKLSARTGELRLREFEHKLNRQVSIYLDTYIKKEALEDGLVRRIERCISFAATLVRDFSRAGFQVNLVAFTPEPVVITDVGGRFPLKHTLRHLALAEPNRKHDANDLLDLAENQLPPARATILIRTTRHFKTMKKERRYSRSVTIRAFDATTSEIESVFHLDSEEALNA